LENRTRVDELTRIWKAVDIVSQEEAERLIHQIIKDDYEKFSMEKTLIYWEFHPNQGYTDEDRLRIFLKRDDRTFKRKLNHLKWLKHKRSLEEVRGLTEGEQKFRAIQNFQKWESKMYQEYLQIYEVLGIPPVGEFEFDSACLMDLKVREQVSNHIKALMIFAKWRNRSKKEKGKGKHPNVRGIMESLNTCTEKYEGSSWERYCTECKSTQCKHATNRNIWTRPKDKENKEQYVYHYKRVEGEYFSLIK
jgi:hypothetical protein